MGCSCQWSLWTGSGTCSRLPERPTRRKYGVPGSLIDLALGVGGVPQLLELGFQVTDPGWHGRKQGSHDNRPGSSRDEGRRRGHLVTHGRVENYEIEHHRPEQFRNELMIQHADVDADITLHLRNLHERLVASQVLALEDEDAPDRDLAGDRLALKIQITKAQVTGPQTAVESAQAGVDGGHRDRVDRVLRRFGEPEQPLTVLSVISDLAVDRQLPHEPGQSLDLPLREPLQ